MSINETKIRPLSWLKNRLVAKGMFPYRVPLGLYQSLHLYLDLSTQSQVYAGLWERETYPWLRQAARRAQWVVDVGAGKGELCLFFAQHSTAHRIVAVEPQASETGWIEANCQLNPPAWRQRIEIQQKCIGRSTDPGYVALDDLGLALTESGFIKVDVDGFEMEVLQSGEHLLREGKVDLLVETHSPQLEKDCVAWLTARGYECQIVDNAWWRFLIPEQRPLELNRWLWATQP
ncbi:MAG TPA: hypothetical protein DCQ32_02955 [Cyanobacteria bacterium UBA8156]|jgi:hypothetical protein|nr:hypothetical protein [Cyanobacteria bacterium UBA8156]